MGQYAVNALDANSEKLCYKLEPIVGAATYDLSDMYMQSKIHITNRRNNPLGKDVDASTVNNILLFAFKKMCIYLNNKAILDMSNFGYAQYFVNRLRSDQTALHTWMATQGYYEDQDTKVDICKTGSDLNRLEDRVNMGYLNRKMCFAKLTPVPPSERQEPMDDKTIFKEGREALKSLGKR